MLAALVSGAGAPLACTSGDASEFTPTDDDPDPPSGPTSGMHLLVSNDDWNGTNPEHSLAEIDMASGEVTWAVEFDDAFGAEGVERLVDGDTLATRKGIAEPHVSYVDRYTPDGTLEWTWAGPEDDGGLLFIHDLVVTQAGNMVVADTHHARVLAADPQGQVLWSLSGFASEGVDGANPNGLDVAVVAPGDERLLITLLSRQGEEVKDSVREVRLLGEGDPPEFLWQYPPVPDGSLLARAHGPRFGPDGIRTVCSALDHRILALDASGQPVWTLPPEGREGEVQSPRDARFLPDGRLLVANSGTGEIVLVEDPFGAFTVVQRFPSPGIFGMDILDCADPDGPPCFGPNQLKAVGEDHPPLKEAVRTDDDRAPPVVQGAGADGDVGLALPVLEAFPAEEVALLPWDQSGPVAVEFAGAVPE